MCCCPAFPGAVVAGTWPWGKRLVYAAACPLIPLVRLRRILFHLQRTGRAGTLLPGLLGPMCLALLAGGIGECLGYLAGGGTAAESKFGLEFRRRDFLSSRDPLGSPDTPAAISRKIDSMQ